MARPCYVAMSPPNNREFSIVPVWDWEGGSCKDIGKLLTSEWLFSNSIVDVEQRVTAFYNGNLPLRHQRCLAHSGSVICRPVLSGDGCGIGETKVCQVMNSLFPIYADLSYLLVELYRSISLGQFRRMPGRSLCK